MRLRQTATVSVVAAIALSGTVAFGGCGSDSNAATDGSTTDSMHHEAMKHDEGAAMKHEGDSMKHQGDSMKHQGDSMKHQGDSMKHQGDSMKHQGDAMHHAGSSSDHMEG